MPSEYLRQRKDFADLLKILEVEKGIQAELIEKDYWIMHVLAIPSWKSFKLSPQNTGGNKAVVWQNLT